jgi:hypothetical protein
VRRSSLLAFLLVLVVRPVSGQGQVSAIVAGTVQDTSGAAVSGATVTVHSLETGATRVVTTDEGGHYAVLALPVGPLEVRAQKEGFKSGVRTVINLSVGQQVVVDFRLEVGPLRQKVTVTEVIPLVITSTGQLSGLVGENEVKNLPLNGRSFDNLITLNPGAINYSSMKSPQTITSNGNTFTVEGRRTSENLFLLNGIEYTGTSQLAITPGGASGELLGIDAIREFNVLKDTYSAEYGKRAGGQIAVVTQSGTNTLHGSAFEFLRNSALDARNFFDRTSVPPFRRNQFGGALGGPAKKDHLFLFGNYEAFRQRLAVSNVSVVPDREARRGFLPDASGVYKPVPNLNMGMLPYMSFWPEPNGAELLVNGLSSGTALAFNNPRQTVREDFGTLRTDYIIRPRDSLSVVYTIDDGESLVPLADPLFASALALRNQVASLQEMHVFTPQVLNTFRAGFSRAGFNYDSVFPASLSPGLSFVSGRGPGGIVIGGGLTTTGAAAVTPAGPNNASSVWNRRNLFTFTDDVQISKGAHQISYGIWVQPLQDNDDTASRQLGQASFSSLQTFLQGVVSNFQAVPDPTELGWRSLLGAWYLVDVVRLRSNLTIQAGVRHEFTTGWNEVAGRAANFVSGRDGVLLTETLVGDSAFTENNAKWLFGPRFAVAWDPFGTSKTAIRAGFGTYYSLLDDLAFLLNSLPPYNGSVSFSNLAVSSFLPVYPNLQQPPACGATVSRPCNIYAPQGVQVDAKTPTVEEWNLTAEHQISSNTLLRLAYVGSFGYHGLLSIDPNSIPAEICSDPSGCQAGGTGTAKGRVARGAQFIPVGTRPNPYLSGGFFWFTEGNSSYNAFQTEVQRRLSRGLQFRANYTWSKNLDMNSGLTGAQANNQAQMVLDRNDLRRDWGASALNVTSQASLSAHYELPFGRGRGLGTCGPGLENKLIGGWQINGIVTLLSGFPFTPLVGSNRSGDGDTRNPDRPSVNPAFRGGVLLRNPQRWFDPAAFVLPAAGTYGNLGRGTFNGPGLAEVDVSISKETGVTERTRLQFRAEFFNLLNRVNFSTPNPIVFSGGTVSSSAGLITATATTSRQVQLGLKLTF